MLAPVYVPALIAVTTCVSVVPLTAIVAPFITNVSPLLTTDVYGVAPET